MGGEVAEKVTQCEASGDKRGAEEKVEVGEAKK